ncbi:MAG: sensor histidine kinase [Piscirickettsiaceae bacterium]|nr:sensor histidine kinase [Piscirickettsiaceae bacterium]
MNLKVQLLYRLLLIAIICLTASAFYVLYQTDKQAISEANFTINSIEQQMRTQLLTMFSRYDFSSSFPNTEHWSDSNNLSGSCIQFSSKSRHRERSLCKKIIIKDPSWPIWFDTLYQQLFSPNFEIKKNISFNAVSYGVILVTLNSQLETARAWNNLRAVIDVLFVSIFAVSLLVFFTINRMLQPAHIIVSGLEKMRNGHLNTRLPTFNIKEWKQTSDAINQLARSQEKSMADNKLLALKLMNIQEEEHRYIARELHDEFGQCLAGINAITTSLHQSAQQHYPDLSTEIKTINPITAHMMDVLRSLLTRLRPSDVDDLGLTSSLNKLIQSWNNRSNGITIYSLTLTENIEHLPEPLPVNIYRIVQECLTNIAKHANASLAEVLITYQSTHTIQLDISDNGTTKTDVFDNTTGIGLLGIKERVAALGGDLALIPNPTGGLTVSIHIPVVTSPSDAHV